MNEATSGPSGLSAGTPGGSTPAAALEQWRARVEKELGEASFDDVLVSTLPGEVVVDALSPDVEAIPDAAGFPGLGTQARGSLPTGLRSGTACAPLRDEPTEEELNVHLLEDLAGGAPAAHLVLDRGARLGDAGPQDGLNARGLLLGTAATLERSLEGVLRDALELSFDAGANARPLLALLHATEDPERRGSYELGHDPLGSLAADGALPGSLDGAWDDAAALVEDARSFPLLRPLALDARPWHEAGADFPTELGLLLSSGAELLRALEARGVSPERAAENLVLRIALDPDVFPSVALLRAARQTWAQVLRACGVAEVAPIRIHAFEGARALSKRDPWVNILRTTTQAFAAQIGGADTFTPLSYDRALGAPGRLGRRIARGTPSILTLEGHVERVVDAAGGSGHVEALTDAIARRAWSIMQRVESAGGLSAGLLAGSVQADVAQSLAARRERIVAGDPGLVGVALFPPDETAVPAEPPSEEVLARRQGATLGSKPDRTLTSLTIAARDGADLAALSSALERGAPATCAALPRVRDAAPFEEEGLAPLTSKPKAPALEKQEASA